VRSGRSRSSPEPVPRAGSHPCAERIPKRASARSPAALRAISEIARLYQTLNFTGDEIRWRLEQLVSLRPEVLQAIQKLTGDHRRFSFYEIARAARLLDGHLPDAGVAAEALHRSVERALESGVPLVDIAYMSVTSGEEI
jgi:hypothetical protein